MTFQLCFAIGLCVHRQAGLGQYK